MIERVKSELQRLLVGPFITKAIILLIVSYSGQELRITNVRKD